MYDDTRNDIITHGARGRAWGIAAPIAYLAGYLITNNFGIPELGQDLDGQRLEFLVDIFKFWPAATAAVEGFNYLGARQRGNIEDRMGLRGPRPRHPINRERH